MATQGLSLSGFATDIVPWGSGTQLGTQSQSQGHAGWADKYSGMAGPTRSLITAGTACGESGNSRRTKQRCPALVTATCSGARVIGSNPIPTSPWMLDLTQSLTLSGLCFLTHKPLIKIAFFTWVRKLLGGFRELTLAKPLGLSWTHSKFHGCVC